MSETLKKFLEEISADEELMKKACTASEEEILALAKEKGYELTAEDLKKQASELSEDELETVAGGKSCYCALGGGGTGDGNEDTCACVVAGAGKGYKVYWRAWQENGEWKDEKTWDSQWRCYCQIGGYGKEMDGMNMPGRD